MDEVRSPSQPQGGTPAENPSLHELKPNAIGLLQSVVVGVATSAPGQSTAVTLAAMAMVTAYATGPAIIICMIPMLAIALCYQRLNLWEQNCGGPYVWVGRSISPWVGYMVGWALLVGYVLGTVSDILPLGPAVLGFLGVNASSTMGNILTATLFAIVVTSVAAVGIQLTARFQVTIAVVEYAILVVFSLIAFYAVFIGHWAGTMRPTLAWLHPTGIGGKGSLIAGILIAIYLFTGWDASIHLNEETEQKEQNPGKAVLISVAFLGPFFVFLMMSFQGAVSPKLLQDNADNALPFMVKSLVGTPWDKLMAVAIILSVIGTTLGALVAATRISYSMSSDRLIFRGFSSVHPQYRTPFIATLFWGAVTIVVSDLYIFSSSLAGAFTNVVSSVGLLFTVFYLFTGVATTWYYRKLLTRSLADFVLVGVLPLGGAIMLAWIFLKSIGEFHGAALWSLIGIAVVGVLLMLASAFVTKSPFFSLRRVAYDPAAESGQQA